MHVVFRDSRGLEETDAPFDPGQTPAPVVVLSFSDSDLGAFAAGWHRAGLGAAGGLPETRLCNLVGLRHPVSVDNYAETVLSGAKAILIRLIGGESYWAYGLASVQDLARRRGIALAVLPADGRADAALDAASTLPVPVLRRLAALCDQGGAVAMQAALAELSRAAGLEAAAVEGAEAVPDCGWYAPGVGVVKGPGDDSVGGGIAREMSGAGNAAAIDSAVRDAGKAACSVAMRTSLETEAGADRAMASDAAAEDGTASAAATGRPLGGDPPPSVAVVFYRSYLTAADTDPVDGLIVALRARGFAAHGLFVPSLKAPGAGDFLRGALARVGPAAIVNATAFSGKGDDGASPLDAPGCPVFQVALSTARRRDWAGAERGLSPADLAMHVVLPEVDGRINAGVVSFKSVGRRDPDLQYARFAHRADADRVAAVADRVAGWVRLAGTLAAERRLALVLSTYPGRPDQIAHAVGLDALASAQVILGEVGGQPPNPRDIYVQPEEGDALARALLSETLDWPVADYLDALATLPQGLQDAVAAAWGAPQDDPACIDGAFRFAAIRRGNALIALQPERGSLGARDDNYHDLTRVPRHAYVAFYLWLRAQSLHALVHIGAHGTLEWLPGKAVALSAACWPEALTGPLPVIYPFIVNDPGEAAQARRRIGAVTLGHMPPPLAASSTPAGLLRLERLLDEYSTADGLDPARRDRLIADIRAEAQASGVETDLAIPEGAAAAEAIPRIDRFVCDIKESQFGDGLHVYGAAPGEAEGLRAAISGRRVPAGPSGSPWRGRADVLPTGRNLYSVDPRAVPSRAAHAQGVKLAEELLRRHLQDKGDWPRGLVVDLWGSASMRTAGEEFAMALHLAGLAPRWDEGSDRVSGVEIVPLALLGRPRIDVTLRISGLFRDVFPTLAQMFQQGAEALADRDEAADMNPYRAGGARVFGPKPGGYGAGVADALTLTDAARDAAGQGWLAGSEWAFAADGGASRDRAGLEDRLRGADAFAHVQDLCETDLLMAADYAAHEGGFAAAMAHLGQDAALYHLDARDPAQPRARTVPEEIARTVRARAANPDWAAGMMRHGFRGAAELAATLDHMAAFQHLTRAVPGHLFDLYHDATLGRPEVVAFMAAQNPAALAALRDRFAGLMAAGLWVTRRNSIAAGVRA